MSMTGIVQNRRHQRRTDVAILKSPPRAPKNETLQIRVEEQIKAKLQKYAEFIDSSESYVVSEALKMLFKKDDEFKSWLQEPLHAVGNSQNGEDAVVESHRTT
jgi:predicted transcriptional regulator